MSVFSKHGSNFDKNVFINCPFDSGYTPIFQAIIFTVLDSGYNPRCALEDSNAGETRIDKIRRIISECRYGVHDISCTELSDATDLPRFNMPLELGMFLGCQYYGSPKQKTKSCLVLDREQYRFSKFISDIGGQDIFSHDGCVKGAIREVRNWLRTVTKDNETILPGAERIQERFEYFQAELPAICQRLSLDPNPSQLIFGDYTLTAYHWLDVTPFDPHVVSNKQDIRPLLIARSYRLHTSPKRSKFITFLGDGTIGKGRNDNEFTWRVRRGKLEILNRQGNVHSRFFYNSPSDIFQHANDINSSPNHNQYIKPTS